MPNWFCLLTKPRHEHQVASYCRDVLALEVYLPQLRQARTIQRVRRIVTGPLFPRYLFCRFDPAISYRAVRYAPDVLDIVAFGGRPAVVADTLIAELQQWAGDLLDLTALERTWHEGDCVKITDGPLSGVTGIVVRLRDDAERVELLLGLLHEGTKTTVSRFQLEPAALATP